MARPYSQSSSARGAAGAATAIVTFNVPRAGRRWQVWQISVQTNSANTSVNAFVYKDGLFVCGTTAGNNDSADGPAPLDLNDSDTLSVQWTGLNPNDQATATVFVDEL